MGSWRLARSLETLRDEVNDRFPKRSKISDGTIGNAAHAARASDHNPNAAGVVTAMDITHSPATGCDAGVLAEHFVALAKFGDKRVKYVIWNRRIASASFSESDRRKGRKAWQWWPYTGANAHTHHVHISVSASPGQYDRTDPWWPKEKPATDLDDDTKEDEMDLRDVLNGTDEGTVAAILKELGKDPEKPISVSTALAYSYVRAEQNAVRNRAMAAEIKGLTATVSNLQMSLDRVTGMLNTVVGRLPTGMEK
jgi:hypothetical protein